MGVAHRDDGQSGRRLQRERLQGRADLQPSQHPWHLLYWRGSQRMKRLTVKACAAVVFITWLGGCATPQAALDQANNGAALTMSLQAELQNLRAAQANVAQLRLESIRRQNAMLATYDVDAAFGERVQQAVGK